MKTLMTFVTEYNLHFQENTIYVGEPTHTQMSRHPSAITLPEESIPTASLLKR